MQQQLATQQTAPFGIISHITNSPRKHALHPPHFRNHFIRQLNSKRILTRQRSRVDIDVDIGNRMALDFIATYKVLVLGDSNVGKTCIVHRYCDEKYYDTYISTIGIDFKQKLINLDGVPIKLQIWDTAGQERFRTLTTAYYRGAMGILLMYDVTNLESYNNLSYWLRNIQENASPDVVKVLAGNKCECNATQRMVDKERGEKIAENFDMPFFEVSCKSNINIEEAFFALARKIREQRERRGDNFENDDKPQDKKSPGSNGFGQFSLGGLSEGNRCSC